ncbi:MAG: hypothetical protein ACO3Q4_02075, partial [Ilumatobacteraceae bacterium]
HVAVRELEPGAREGIGEGVGVLVEMASLVVPTELKTTPALAILILVLLFRPQGLLGKAQRVG